MAEGYCNRLSFVLSELLCTFITSDIIITDLEFLSQTVGLHSETVGGQIVQKKSQFLHIVALNKLIRKNQVSAQVYILTCSVQPTGQQIFNVQF